MKIRITSDGKPNGTRIFDEETGQDIPGIKSVEIVYTTNKALKEPVPLVILYLEAVEVDIVVDDTRLMRMEA